MNKSILFLIIFIGLSTLVWYQYFYDDVVTSGSKYGFEIGMTKDKAIEAIGKEYSKDDIQVLLSPKSHLNLVSDISYVDVHQLNGDRVENMNIWQLRFQRSEKNVLVLHFSDGQLDKMTRYRRAFIP